MSPAPVDSTHEEPNVVGWAVLLLCTYYILRSCCSLVCWTPLWSWFKAGGIFGFSKPIAYYALGCLVYQVLEGWGPLDTIYFLTVTSTTVGYGDFCPTTALGKAFTCVYSLIGITVILNALSPLVAFLHGDWRDKLLKAVGCAPKVDLSDMSLTIEEVNASISYPRRYALALIGPVFVFIAGIAIHFFTMRESASVWEFEALMDSTYWALITMTTIGYGDITPATTTSKILAIIYLPIAVIALADAVSDVSMIGRRREIRETDFSAQADTCLIRDALRDTKPNMEPVLTEAEFLIDQLVANKLVDEAAVNAIIRQYKHLTRNGNFAADEEPKLTRRLVYEGLRERVAADKQVSAECLAYDVVDGNLFKWASYEEWVKQSWEKRILAQAGDAGSTETKSKRLSHKGQALKTIVGQTADLL